MIDFIIEEEVKKQSKREHAQQAVEDVSREMM